MKLTDLEPRWWADEPGRTGMGITFLCPHCKKQRLGVAFSNPIDGGKPEHLVHPYTIGSAPEWNRSGDTFDTLTLTPSIDASKHGHWHGFITNGEIR